MHTFLSCICIGADNSDGKVISWIATAVSWSSRLNAKVFISRDQFDTMVETAMNDPIMLEDIHTGLRRKVGGQV